ncbi:MAG: alkaline phosphatase family protein [Thermoanaerobaculia bacterium]|nr:alkaline phosphatase family protein [Thermoanaerobaculia bacterium]
MPSFDRYIGIDYSGAQTPTSSLKGLRVYVADQRSLPTEVPPPPSPRRYWSRRGVAEWLVDRLTEGVPTLVGIDHGFSFPLAYFESYGLQRSWPVFLDDFQNHWPADEDKVTVDCIRFFQKRSGCFRQVNTRWRRLTEKRTGSAKSVFHFDAKGSVAKSTHAGLPWLRYLRHRVSAYTHFWPFGGWDIPAGHSAIVEVYPRLWSGDYPQEHRTADQHDAYSVAAKLRCLDLAGHLLGLFDPALTPQEREVAAIEGWILGAT